jgi:hypothetical protein
MCVSRAPQTPRVGGRQPPNPGGMGGGSPRGSENKYLLCSWPKAWYDYQRDPAVFVGQVFLFGGLGYQGHKTAQFPETSGWLALPPSAARPKTIHFSNKFGFWALVPQSSKKHLAKTQLRDPRARISIIVPVETAIFLFKTHQCKWGASPPTCADGFWIGRFDPNNRRIPGPTL